MTGPAMDLLWEETFAGPSGSLPDPAAWNIETGNAETDGWGNHELQWYSDDPRNLCLDGYGHLAITALPAGPGANLPCWDGRSCPYTSARITTQGKVEVAHGRVEARIALPNGTGLLPAFWMLGVSGEDWPACGEIDIVELLGSEPNRIFGTVHGPGYSGANGPSHGHVAGPSWSGEFHTYGVERYPGCIRWFVDDHVYGELTPDTLPPSTAWVFDQPFYLLLNLAVGGYLPGKPNESTRFPATMLVDRIRIEGTGKAP